MMCRFFGVSRSGYYDFVQHLGRPEPDADLARMIEIARRAVEKHTAIAGCGCG